MKINILDYWYRTLQDCNTGDWNLVERPLPTTTTTTALSTTTAAPAGPFCVTNPDQSEIEICNQLKWLCDNPEAHGYLDMRQTSCADWVTRGCCYAEDGGAGCNSEELNEDGDVIFDEWYRGTNDNCASKYTQLEGGSLICEAKDSSSNAFICGKLKWYCHDPNAQNLLDMQNLVCGNNQLRDLKLFI